MARGACCQQHLRKHAQQVSGSGEGNSKVPNHGTLRMQATLRLHHTSIQMQHRGAGNSDLHAASQLFCMDQHGLDPGAPCRVSFSHKYTPVNMSRKVRPMLFSCRHKRLLQSGQVPHGSGASRTCGTEQRATSGAAHLRAIPSLPFPTLPFPRAGVYALLRSAAPVPMQRNYQRHGGGDPDKHEAHGAHHVSFPGPAHTARAPHYLSRSQHPARQILRLRTDTTRPRNWKQEGKRESMGSPVGPPAGRLSTPSHAPAGLAAAATGARPSPPSRPRPWPRSLPPQAPAPAPAPAPASRPPPPAICGPGRPRHAPDRPGPGRRRADRATQRRTGRGRGAGGAEWRHGRPGGGGGGGWRRWEVVAPPRRAGGAGGTCGSTLCLCGLYFYWY